MSIKRISTALLLALCVVPARADTTVAVSGKETLIHTVASWDQLCVRRDVTLSNLSAEHGTVTARKGPPYKINKPGTCNGKSVVGFGIYDNSAPGYHGADTVSYTATRGQKQRWGDKIKISVK